MRTVTAKEPSSSAVPLVIKRVTTEYVESEDRVRLSCETEDSEAMVLWVTQRLALRLIPVLLRWLSPETPASNAPVAWTQQEFAQDAARASLAPQNPVQVLPLSRQALVDAIDFQFGTDACQMLFRGPDLPQGARLVMAPLPLRQWLGIVHQQFARAQWPMSVWPAWMEGAAAPVSAGANERLQLH